MFKQVIKGLAGAAIVLALILTACQPAPPEPTPTPTEEPAPPPDEPTPTPEEPVEEPTPTEEPAPPEERPLEGETVSVIAVWGGAELDSFRAMVAPWEEETGATVEYEGTRDIEAVLTTRIAGDNPPDVAGLPGPGQLLAWAEEGELVDVSTFLDMDALREDYDEGWIELARLDDGLYGVFIKATVKSFVWYSPPAFEAAGYEVPETWNEMIALSEQIVADGGTPWCIGLESGAASGWPGTDWIEDIMLRTALDVYDNWWQYEDISWTDDEIRNAWEMWGTIVTNEDFVWGGTTGVLATNFGEAVYPLLEEPAGCYMHRQATFIQDFLMDQFPEAVPQEDFNYFMFPPIDEAYGSPMLVAGDLFGMFNDTPAARSLIEWLISAEAQQIWAERGGFIAPNRQVPADVYPDVLIGQAAEMLATADVVRFDASDMMPSAVNDAFWSGILEFVENPDQLDQILQSIDEIAQEAY